MTHRPSIFGAHAQRPRSIPAVGIPAKPGRSIWQQARCAVPSPLGADLPASDTLPIALHPCYPQVSNRFARQSRHVPILRHIQTRLTPALKLNCETRASTCPLSLGATLPRASCQSLRCSDGVGLPTLKVITGRRDVSRRSRPATMSAPVAPSIKRPIADSRAASPVSASPQSSSKALVVSMASLPHNFRNASSSRGSRGTTWDVVVCRFSPRRVHADAAVASRPTS